MKIVAHWSNLNESFEQVVDGKEPALRLVDHLHKARDPAAPPLVEFRDDSTGLAFGIGVGREVSVATYQQSDDPPYFIGLGDRDASGTTWFCYGTQHSEYLASNLVAPDLARQALAEFFDRNGERPSAVEWEQL
jgi:uncharacterized protein (DUF736 family)